MSKIILHDGGECPVPPETVVIPHYRGTDDLEDLRIICAPASRLDWTHDGGPNDIVGYEIVSET